MCDDPGGLPFLGIEHHVTGQIWAIPAPSDQVQDPPGHDQVNHLERLVVTALGAGDPHF